jgi:flagellar biogenesis protein FliO
MRLMLRATFLIFLGLIILWLAVLPLAAQPAETGDESTGEADITEQPLSEESDTTIDPSGDADILPADLPTMEFYEQESDDGVTIGPTLADYLKVFAGLLVVIGVIWGISVLTKKLVTVQGLASSTESLKVITTLSLTPTRTLYMIRLGDRIILIGAGDGGLRTLAEIKDPDEVATILRDIEFKGNFDLNPFRDRLQSRLGESDEDIEIGDDLNVRQHKLKDVLDRLKSGDEDIE